MKLLRSSIFLLLASTRRGSAQYCGCSSCTEAIWTTPSTDASGIYPCGDRIQWLQTELGYDETAACVKVSGEEFPDGPCGPVCNPEAVECNPPTPIRCGCSTCSDEVWSGTSATDGGGTHSCGARIEWLQSELGYSENDACGIVGGEEFPDICGLCDPNKCDAPRPTLAPTEPPSPEDPPTFACGCESCTDEVLDNLATDASGTYSCGSRINWLQSEQSFTEQSACALVSEDFPSICSTACHPFECDTETKSPSPTFESTPLPSYVLNGDDTVVSNGASALVVTNAKIDDTISIGGTPRTSPLAIYVWVNDKNGRVCPQPTYAGSSWPLILLGGDYRIEEGVDCVAQMLQGTNVPFLCCNSPEHGFLPMYQFVGDSSPIDVNGEGLGEVWFSIPSSTTATPNPTPRGETSSPVASPIDDAPCPNTDNMPSCPVPNLFEDLDWTITNECVIESGVYTFRKLIITNGSTVVVRPDADVSMNVAGGILVNDRAALFVGCPTDPFLGAFDVTFTGGRSDLASGERWIKVGTATWANALVVENAKLEIHGMPKTSWASLIKTATPGDTSIELATPSAWQPGDEVIVVQSSSNRDEVERRTIASANGNVLQLTEALEHTHEGGFVGRGTRLNAEVGVLSHNIRFHGSFDWNQCQSNFRGDGLPINGEEAKSECFGGILTFLKESAVHIENAEFDRLGQGLAMGRYPLHWHLAENVQGSYVRNVAVHSSANRCVTVHGSFAATIDGLVCYNTHGHNLYLEDGIEAGNSFLNNLVVNPVNSHTICTDRFGQESGPTGLWITNANNTFIGNTVVGAAFGAWVTTPTGGGYGHNPYSTNSYDSSSSAYGGTFGASARYYNEAPGYGPDSWVMNQEQARTPVKAFRDNSFKGSLRMAVAADFRVYNSEDAYIPCSVSSPYSESECPTCPNVGHTFTWGPMAFDAGLPVSERSYAPVAQEFEGIVIAHTPYNFFGREAFTVWTTGGTISMKDAIFYRNEVGSSLGHEGHCAGSLLGAAGSNLRLEDAVFVEGNAPFKLYDGGYFCSNCRWAALSFLATVRPGSPGNVNGLILERTSPLGWRDEDETDPLFSWLWESEWDAGSKVTARAPTVPDLVDFSSSSVQTSWEAEYMAVQTTDGLYGTASSLNGEFTQFIRVGNPSPTVWGLGVAINPNPNFRQFQPCRGGRGECADGRFCDDTMFEGRDIPNAPWAA